MHMKEVFNGMPPDCGSGTQTARHECFRHGNVRIVISEHFAPEGRTAGSLMEDVILHEAKQHDAQKVS